MSSDPDPRIQTTHRRTSRWGLDHRKACDTCSHQQIFSSRGFFPIDPDSISSYSSCLEVFVTGVPVLLQGHHAGERSRLKYVEMGLSLSYSWGSITYGSFQLSSDRSCRRVYPSCPGQSSESRFSMQDPQDRAAVRHPRSIVATRSAFATRFEGDGLSNMRPYQAPSRVAVLLTSKIPMWIYGCR